MEDLKTMRETMKSVLKESNSEKFMLFALCVSVSLHVMKDFG